MTTLTFSVDINDLFDYDNDEMIMITTFEKLITESLMRAIKEEIWSRVQEEQFKEFVNERAAVIDQQIKTKFESFLDEEIVLTGKWGKTEFVGSIEDYIKMRVDNTILHIVNEEGQEAQHCYNGGRTWLQWRIETILKDQIKRIKNDYSSKIINEIKKQIENYFNNFIGKNIKERVSSVMAPFLTKTSGD